MHCHLVGIPHSNGHVYYSNGKIIIQKCHKCTSCFSKFKILEHNIWQELEIYPNGRWIFNHQLHQFVHHSSICLTESCRSLPSCQQVFFVVRNIPQSTDLMSSLNEAVNSFDLIRGQRRKIVASQLRFPCKQTQRKKKKLSFTPHLSWLYPEELHVRMQSESVGLDIEQTCQHTLLVPESACWWHYTVLL